VIEIKKNNNNSYGFRLTTSSGATLFNSISFDSQDDVKKRIQWLSATQKKRLSFERKTNHVGKFHFTLKDADGIEIGSSQFYASEAGMENGIKNFRNHISS